MSSALVMALMGSVLVVWVMVSVLDYRKVRVERLRTAARQGGTPYRTNASPQQVTPRNKKREIVMTNRQKGWGIAFLIPPEIILSGWATEHVAGSIPMTVAVIVASAATVVMLVVLATSVTETP
jgi:hypothetical protein